MRRLMIFWVLAGLILGSSGATGRVLYVLDFDGSINNDHSPHPAWKTRWILFRVSNLRSLLQTSPYEMNLPETIELSYGEYVRLRPLLAKGEGVLGDLRPVDLDPDDLWTDRPKRIVPGYYYVDPNFSFKYYRPGRKKNHLLSDYKTAKVRDGKESGRDGWKGLAFPLLQKVLDRPETVGDLVILTSRFHHDRDYLALLQEMKADGQIRHTQGKTRSGRPTSPRFISLQAPQALAFGRYGIAQRKALAVVDLARELLESSDQAEHPELSPDLVEARSGVRRPMHTLIVAEDTPSIVESLRKALEGLSAELGFHAKVKFVLLNTGTAENVAQSRWPYRWTVFHHGFGRPAHEEEIKAWSGEESGDCESRLLEVAP